MKFTKKIIALLLSVVMIAGIMTIMPISVSAVESSNKQEMLSDNLFYNATYYNNDLAKVCANLCCDAEDVSGYFPPEQSYPYTWDVDNTAFHVGIGYKTICTNGFTKNLLVITCRGTGKDSPFEILADWAKDLRHYPYENQEALFGPYKYVESIQSDINQFIIDHPAVREHPIVYLVTGHSLGGAAANLLGARLTNMNGGDTSDNVFCYTFGAIKAITSENNVEDGYKNIFNVYNHFDSFGPNGGNAPLGVSDPYYKFGYTFFVNFKYEESSPTSLENHDMNNYRDEVEAKRVNVTIHRKAGILDSGQRWSLSNGCLKIYGSGALSDVSTLGTNASWYRYIDEITDIVIQNGITEIGENGFSSFSNLETIHIPASVIKIGNYAFFKCNSLSDIYFSGTNEQWNAINVDYSYANEALKKATLHCLGDNKPSTDDLNWSRVIIEYGSCGTDLIYALYADGTLEIIGSGEMTSHPWTKKCADRISEVHFSDGVSSICYDAFKNCISLRKFNTTENLISVGDGAFENTAWYENQPDGIVYAGHIAYGVKGNIPSEIVLDDETRGIADYAFRWEEGLISVSLNSKLEHIGYGAFANCTNLERINLSIEGLKTIDNDAFGYCEKLEEAIIGNNVTDIGEGAFSGCKGLKKVVIGSSVQRIEKYAFIACPSLENFYVLSKNTNDYSDDIFGDIYYSNKEYGNPQMQIFVVNSDCAQVFFIAAQKDIRCYEFEVYDNNKASITVHNYDESENIVIPEKILDYSVSCVKSFYFDQYFDLDLIECIKSVTLPKTLTEEYVNNYEWYDGSITRETYYLSKILSSLHSLESITVSNDNPVYSSLEGVLYNKDFSELIACPMKKVDIAIPTSVKKVDWYAFCDDDYFDEDNTRGYYSEHNLTFSDNFSDIVFYDKRDGYESFRGRWCGVKSIFVTNNFPENTFVGSYNSYGLGFPQLENIYVTNESTKYSSYDGVLYNKDMTKLIAVPIKKKEINIPATVSDISKLKNYDNSDYDEYKYETINVAENNESFISVDGVLFSKDMKKLLLYPSEKKDGVYVIPDGIEEVDGYAFSVSDNLKSITVPDSVKKFNSFERVSKDKNSLIIYAYSKSDAQRYAYENKIKFVSLGMSQKQNVEFDYSVLDDGTVKLEHYNKISDSDDFSIPSDVLGDPVSIIGNIFNYSWQTDRENVKTLNVPDSVKTIEYHAFYKCKNLKSIEFNEQSKLEKIEDNAFTECTSLESVKLGNNVLIIDDYAFCSSEKLKSISIPSSIKYIGREALGYYEFFDYSGGGVTEHILKVDDFTIYGYSGTVAETYAHENGFNFVSLGQETSQPTTTNPAETEPDETIGKLPVKQPNPLQVTEEDVYVDLSHYNGDDAEVYPLTVTDAEGEVVYTLQQGDSDYFTVNESTGALTVSAQTPVDEYTIKIKVGTLGNDYFKSKYITKTINVTVEKDEEESETLNGKGFEFYILDDGTAEITRYTGPDVSEIQIPSEINGYVVTSLREELFGECTTLEKVVVPESVKKIVATFDNCKSLKEISVSPNNIDFTSLDGNLYNKDLTKLIQYAIGKEATEFTIPDSVTNIGYFAFGSSNLKTIKMSNNVTTIEAYAFVYNHDLESVELSINLETILYHAFTGCEKLKKLILPKSVSKIDYHACGFIEVITDNKIEGFKIYGYSGTTAETYAKDNDVEFVCLDEVSTEAKETESITATNPTDSTEPATAVTEPTTDKPTDPTQPVTDEPTEPTEPVVTQPATETSTQAATEAPKTTVKKPNPVKVSVKKKTVKLKKLKKKAQKVKAITVKNAKGKVTYKLVAKGITKSIRKLVKINSKGVITIKRWKKAKTGDYKIKLKITAKGNKGFNKKTVTKTVKIRIE